jgi:peptidoglycan/xylan/chitin deacetylase (PgdA/CDA1 family)
VAIGPSGLPVPPGAANVPKPSGTAVGLAVLDWAGFKGAVTYTFDDANSSQIAHYSELQALGVRLTFYLITGKTEASNAIWAQAVKDGHELANHTKSHLSAGTGQDIDDATTFIKQKFGVDVWTMAAPNGAAVYTDLAKTRFLINRGVANGLIGPNDSTDPFTLFCYIPEEGSAASALNSQIDAARTAGKWRVVLVHGFTGGSDGAYKPVAIGEFTSSVAHTKSLTDMWIDSMVNVGAYWRGQKAFSSVTATTSGSDKVWTWTLPAHFPPKKYLRVKVDGGTLKQSGTALSWDSHGYYEVALDAGSLTLSP